MQPTLYGIYPPEPGLIPYPNQGKPTIPEMVIGIAFQGRIYEANGYRGRGDHIFVDRFTYHFRKPQRGEVIVFDTTDIVDIPETSRGKFYIKRLIGLGGDTVQIKPPYALINGSILDKRAAFKRIYSRADGYNGYVLPRGFPPPKFIGSQDDVYTVPEGSLFVLGDNSVSSLDGRFWGSVQEKALVGRSVFVYWPFSRRFGLID
jgi:signal peptidase I